MKKFLFSLLFLLILGGCGQGKQSVVPEPQPVVRAFQKELFVPQGVSATEQTFDVDGDGNDEHVLQYTLHNVVRRENDLRTITYIDIYQLKDDEWERIKRDEVTEEGGTVDSHFCQMKVVNLGDDKTEEFLVEKCQARFPSPQKYYIFGKQKDGSLNDFAIPKGYLHTDKYLNPKEDFMQFWGVAYKDEGVQESYKFACPARDWYAGRFGDQSGGWCRKIIIFIPYEILTNSFGTPEIISEKILIDESFYKNDIPVENLEFPAPCREFPENKSIIKEPFSRVVKKNSNGVIYSDGRGFANIHGIVRKKHTTVWDEEVELVYLAIDKKDQDTASAEAFYDHFIYEVKKLNTVNHREGDTLFFTLGTIWDGQLESTAWFTPGTEKQILAALKTETPVTLKLSVPWYQGSGAPAHFSFACKIEYVRRAEK